jgi:hypothetical protein
MNTIKKIVFFILSCVAFINVSINCFSNDGNNMWRGAAIGGLAGGRKGAAIGLGVGAFTDVASNAAADNRRRRYNDDQDQDNYYYNKRRNYLGGHRKLQQENEELRQRVDRLEQQQAQDYENN